MPREVPLDDPSTEAVVQAAEAALDRDVADATPIAEGLNAVYRVDLADGDRTVLKAATLATGDELLTEAVLFRRLAAGTAVPVPDLLAVVGPDGSTLGVPFLLTAHRPGRTVTDLLELPGPARERLVRESGRHLAGLHDLDLGAGVGFGDLRIGDGPEDNTGAWTGNGGGRREGSLVAVPGHDDWPRRFRELAGEVADALRGEGYTADDAARFADLAPAVREALSGIAGRPAVEPAVTYGDYRPANLVLAPGDDADPLVRAVVDFGGCSTGDPLLDLALAEDALVDVPLGGTDRADRLRRALRDAYSEARADPRDPATDGRYRRYRLYARARHAGAFGYWSQFAREDDPDAVARRWRSFVEDRLAELE